MNPKEFAEVRKLLHKPNRTQAEDEKVQQAYNCLVAVLGKKRVKYLYRLVREAEWGI